MKKINFAVMAVAGALALGSCSLDNAELYDQKDADEAFTALADVKSGMNGAYYYLGQYEFLGNYAVSLGDFAAGVSTGSASSGHFYYISDFSFADTDEEFEDTWNYGYKVITSATNVINASRKLVEEDGIVDSEKPSLYSYMSQCYALKALAEYYLVNLYGLPYSTANAGTPGIVVIDSIVPQAFDKVERGTVKETYEQIEKDLVCAMLYNQQAGDQAETSSYYMGLKGIYALTSRVAMSLGEYSSAEKYAKLALERCSASEDVAPGTMDDNVPSNSAYLSMWGSTAESAEDIFAIKKSDDDNLSANSLSTLYNSYYATIQNTAIEMFGDGDIRSGLFKESDGGGTTTSKYDGASALAVSNIRIFRKSEMSLIVAECEARNNNFDEAYNYLMFTAKRNTDLSLDSLKSYVNEIVNVWIALDEIQQGITVTEEMKAQYTQDAILRFISEERVREFYGEGHRFYDARRMGDIINGDNFTDWDIKNFVFPIPSAEINSGFGVTQNEGWDENLPF